MSAPGNVFYKAAVAMREALDKYERETDTAQLLAGDPIEVAERWRCSAVKLKDGNWLVVPFSDPVQIDGSKRRIRAFGGGLLSGRAKYFDLAWLQQHAEAVALGTLVLPDGAGREADFSAGADGRQRAHVVAGEAPADGVFRACLMTEGDSEVEVGLSLSAALVKVGAPLTRLDAGLGEEADSVDVVQLTTGTERTGARAIASVLAELGCVEADAFNRTLGSERPQGCCARSATAPRAPLQRSGC